MATDFSKHNKAFSRTLGKACIFTPAATGVPRDIRGVLCAGEGAEGLPPGESVNPILFIDRQDVVPTPAAGDEILIGATVYVVLGNPEAHDEEGLYLHLRKDRTV